MLVCVYLQAAHEQKSSVKTSCTRLLPEVVGLTAVLKALGCLQGHEKEVLCFGNHMLEYFHRQKEEEETELRVPRLFLSQLKASLIGFQALCYGTAHFLHSTAVVF